MKKPYHTPEDFSRRYDELVEVASISYKVDSLLDDLSWLLNKVPEDSRQDTLKMIMDLKEIQGLEIDKLLMIVRKNINKKKSISNDIL